MGLVISRTSLRFCQQWHRPLDRATFFIVYNVGRGRFSVSVTVNAIDNGVVELAVEGVGLVHLVYGEIFEYSHRDVPKAHIAVNSRVQRFVADAQTVKLEITGINGRVNVEFFRADYIG